MLWHLVHSHNDVHVQDKLYDSFGQLKFNVVLAPQISALLLIPSQEPFLGFLTVCKLSEIPAWFQLY